MPLLPARPDAAYVVRIQALRIYRFEEKDTVIECYEHDGTIVYAACEIN